jgi:hypothetical protein
MQLFSRQMVLNAPLADSMAYAVGMAAEVSSKMGAEVALWSGGLGAPVGTVAYTMRVEGVADLAAKVAALSEDADYQAKLSQGAGHIAAPPMDSLGSPLHGDLGDPPPVGSYAVVTSAQIANGQYAEAVGWGIDVAQHVTALSGMPVMLLMQEYGPFGTLTWIGGSPDAAGVDASAAATNADADYIAKLSAAGDLFVPGSGQRMLATRIA